MAAAEYQGYFVVSSRIHDGGGGGGEGEGGGELTKVQRIISSEVLMKETSLFRQGNV